ncbi:MAG: nuclear transport factor 2 family protein [Alphaproteobacteria bacterium]|nr:nuclear transport factor 2 family protein [Alphaproteobacteria bacterium]
MSADEDDATLTVDPVAFVREVEKVWQARDGRAAAAAYTDDAVVYYGQGQAHRGEALRNWPAAWFAYAKDLHINKTYRGHHGDCIAGTWESRYTNPETGKVMRERGAELFFLRGEMVYEHHMWQHSWSEGETPENKGFSTD